MSGTKVSQLSSATTVALTDITYLVNGGNPRSLSLAALIQFLLSQNVITTVNGHSGVAGAVTLAKSDIGLANVPNVIPVTSLNSMTGAVTVTAGTGLTITPSGNTIAVGVSPTLALPWGALSGTIANQYDLATMLAAAGIQQGVRTITVTSFSTSTQSGGNFLPADPATLWTNVNCPSAISVNIPAGMGSIVGALLEVRQVGSGPVSITNDPSVTLFSPIGVPTKTIGIGTRMQLVNIGPDSWEYR